MDIRKLRATAEISFQLNVPEPVELKFVVRPIAFDRVRALGGVGDITETERKLVSEAIVDWNLEEDGQAIPCTEENKEKYLDFLFRLRVDVDAEKNPIGATILDRIFEFASEQKNFFVL